MIRARTKQNQTPVLISSYASPPPV